MNKCLSSDTSGLTDLHLGSWHAQNVTDQLQRCAMVNRPEPRHLNEIFYYFTWTKKTPSW